MKQVRSKVSFLFVFVRLPGNVTTSNGNKAEIACILFEILKVRYYAFGDFVLMAAGHKMKMVKLQILGSCGAIHVSGQFSFFPFTARKWPYKFFKRILSYENGNSNNTENPGRSMK